MRHLRHFMLSACLSTLATATLADVIPVRSGAHEGFSRLVLDVPPGTDWSLENQPGLVRIMISDHDDGFDIGNVFNRIDQRHIATVRGRSNILEVGLSCDCVSAAFEEGGQMIVVDISDAPPEQDDPTPAIRSQSATAEEDRLVRFGTAIQKPGAVSRPRSIELRDLPLFGSAGLPAAPVDPNPPDTVARQLDEAQSDLAAQFGAAATRGLLKPSTPAPQWPLSITTPQVGPLVPDGTPERPSANLPVTSNLRITSSTDQPNNAMLQDGPTSTGITCIDPETINVRGWGAEQPFSAMVASHRTSLYTELGRLDHEAAIRLVQTYLHFGFGAEARQVLLLEPALARDHPALIEVAEIMEFGRAVEPEFLHHFLACDSDAALWAILSKPTIKPGTEIDTAAALRAVTALPMHLRSFIAPELSRRFLNLGDTAAAAAALRSLERTAQPLSASGNLAKANLEIASGKVVQAQERFAQIITSNVEQSAEALIQFVDSHLDADAQIDESVATLVEGYALQMRDEPIGAELRRAHVLALGKSGQFDEAFDALDRVRIRDAAAADHALTSSILTLLTQNGSDITFLDHVFRQMPTSLGMVDPTAKIKMADRLVDLGFAREAEIVMASRDDIPKTGATKTLRARIALALNRPFEAEAAIFGLDTDEANTLRAHAKAQTGSYKDASDLFDKAGAESESRQAAWLSEGWFTLIDDQTPVFGEIAQVAQMDLPNNPDLDGMLGRTSAAIAESAAARAAIQELLNASATTDPFGR